MGGWLGTVLGSQVEPQRTCIFGLHRSLALRNCNCGPVWRPSPRAASTAAAQAPPPSLAVQFDQLAAVLAPGALVRADHTPLGRGLVAAQSVKAGSTLLAVDWANCVCVTDDPRKGSNAFSKRVLQDWQLVHGKLPPLLQAYLLSGEDWFLRLTAWMLFLTTRMEQGPLTVYKQLLPQPEEMSCLMNFLPEERPELQSSILEAAAAREREDILGLHARVFASEGGELRAMRLAAGGPGDTVWAASLVNSRCFSETVEGEVVSMIVPCADMANHLNSPNAVYGYSAQRDAFELTSLKGIAAGEEVCISYGCQHKDNTELMRDYGFVIPANPNDRIPFATGKDVMSQLMTGSNSGAAPGAVLHAGRLLSTVQSPAAATRLSPATAARLPAVLQSLRPFQRPDTLGPSPTGQAAALKPTVTARSGATAAVRAAGSRGGGLPFGGLTPGEAAAACQQAEQAVPPLTEQEVRQERLAVAALREQCAGMLAAHGTTAATDEGLLRAEGLEGAMGLSPRMRQALEARLERKRVIMAAAEVLGMYTEERLG